MRKKRDPRINVSYATIREFTVLFWILAAFNGFHMWLYNDFFVRGLIETNKQFVINFLIIYMLIVTAVIMGLTAFIRYISWSRPMRKLSEAASEIARGDFSVRITPLRKDGKKDYVEVMFDDFNKMAEELDASRKALKNYTDNLEAMVYEKTKSVLNLQNAVLASIANMMEFRDQVTGGHINRTQQYLEILVEELIREGIYVEELVTKDMDFFLPSAQLHDVGKIAISDLILNKPEKLTTDEFSIMKTHVTAGVNTIKGIMDITDEHAFLKSALLFSETHHEKWDGTGYPRGLAGMDIPLEGRLMAIVDVYDALISVRPYKKAYSPDEAKKIILDGAGTSFDPVLVDAFHNVADEFARISAVKS